MTGRKNRALQVPPVVPYKALGNFPKVLYGTTGGTCRARFPVLQLKLVPNCFTHLYDKKPVGEHICIWMVWLEDSF